MKKLGIFVFLVLMFLVLKEAYAPLVEYPPGSIISLDCSNVVADGASCYDIDDDIWYVGNGTSAIKVHKGNFVSIPSEFDNGNCAGGGNKTITLTNGNIQKVTFTGSSGNCTLTISFPSDSAVSNLTLRIFQDGVSGGVGLVCGSSQGCLWPGGTTPTLTAIDNAHDIISCKCYHSVSKCECGASLDMK